MYGYGCVRISCSIKGVYTFGLCVSRFSSDKKKPKRKGPSRGVTQKCEPHERNPCAPKFEERTQDETLHQERCARRVAWDFAKMSISSKNTDNDETEHPKEI